MSSQFVDINGDGHNDIVVGSYCGSPYVLYGSKKGFAEPEMFKDSKGERVLIEAFWDDKEKKWSDTDRCGSKGHCTSVAVVDWDGDKDLDLVLGDYRGGRMFVRINEGTAKAPKFATKNIPVLAGGKPIEIPGGLSAPRIVDWNKDGKFDLLCGGYKGGVFLYKNIGSSKKPEFGKVEVLLPKSKKQEFIVTVPSKDGLPTAAGSSFHIEAVDYDRDGDLDLLIGARSAWEPEKVKERSPEDIKLYKKLSKEMQAINRQFSKLMKDVPRDKVKDVVKSKEYKELIKKMRDVQSEMTEVAPPQKKSGDFVWLYRRK